MFSSRPVQAMTGAAMAAIRRRMRLDRAVTASLALCLAVPLLTLPGAPAHATDATENESADISASVLEQEQEASLAGIEIRRRRGSTC